MVCLSLSLYLPSLSNASSFTTSWISPNTLSILGEFFPSKPTPAENTIISPSEVLISGKLYPEWAGFRNRFLLDENTFRCNSFAQIQSSFLYSHRQCKSKYPISFSIIFFFHKISRNSSIVILFFSPTFLTVPFFITSFSLKSLLSGLSTSIIKSFSLL